MCWRLASNFVQGVQVRGFLSTTFQHCTPPSGPSAPICRQIRLAVSKGYLDPFMSSIPHRICWVPNSDTKRFLLHTWLSRKYEPFPFQKTSKFIGRTWMTRRLYPIFASLHNSSFLNMFSVFTFISHFPKLSPLAGSVASHTQIQQHFITPAKTYPDA